MDTLLNPALPGQLARFDGLACHVDGRGSPLLLVHSVNAAPSSIEMRTLYEAYRSRRTVFALDLPGFGLSERTDIDYTPRRMTDALHSAAAFIQSRCGPQPIDAVALSLGCEFLARAASEAPARFGRLALISPTGLDGHQRRRGMPGSTREVPGLHALLRQRLWAEWLYRRLTRPQSVRHFLEGTFGRARIDETLWAHAVANARQPGARHAPLHFLAGKLFSNDIHAVYDGLSQPVWMSHGNRGDFKDFRAVDLIPGALKWQRTEFATGAMPHLELPQEFCRMLDDMLLHAPPPQAPRPTPTPHDAAVVSP